MNSDISIVKRNGQKVPFDFKKIKKIVNWAVEGIEKVDADYILDSAKIYFFNGISTKEIHQSLVEAATNLISVDFPNYQFVASRLLNYALRKEVWGSKNPPRLLDLVKSNTDRGFYDKEILKLYSKAEINKMNEFINHDMDFEFTHGGLNQVIRKYLIQDRDTKEIVETPQFSYLLTAATLFADEPRETRLEWVQKAYNYFNKWKINLATPVLAGARTPLRSYASCCLLNVGDSLKSIGATDYLLKVASAARYGLGLNVSRIRPLGAKIRGGDVLHTGLIPYLKNFESGIRSCHQNGLRGSSGTVYISDWHYEVDSVVCLKDNALPDDKAVRHLDYCICMSDLFLERFKNRENYTLFDPNEVPELTESFGTPKWRDLYIAAENNPNIKMKRVIAAKDLMRDVAKQRLQTGRVYVMFIDNANKYTPFNERIEQSNLCAEILQPTIPSSKWNDPDALIGVCILSAINPYAIESDEEFEDVCRVIVRMLDNLIERQSYFDLAAENFAKKYRSLGIGAFNFAAYMAKNGVSYESDYAPQFASDFAEKLSYYCIKASIELAKERGPFEYIGKTKWKDAILPVDNYCRNVDEYIDPKPKLDWELLRSDLIKYGIRNATLTAYMPIESCLKWDTKVTTNLGYINFHEILEYGGLSHKEIEDNNLVGWHQLDKPLLIPTKDGNKQVDNIYYNGVARLIEIEMENGHIVKCTENHKFLTKNGWVRAKDLKESDEIEDMRV